MIYAIDVDGVIVDSFNEIVIDSLNAYKVLFPKNNIIKKRLTLKNYKEFFKKNKPLLKRFKELQLFSTCAEEIIFNCYIIDNNMDIESEKEYIKELKKISRSKQNKWHKENYKQRYIFQKQKGWQETIKPFPKMINFIKKNIEKSIILSNKDKPTIKKILEHYKIKMKDENLFTEDITDDKNKKLKLIKTKYKVKYKDIKFIEIT